MRRRGTFLERFWEKVDVGAPDDCWPWVGARNQNGYGVVSIRRGRKCLLLGAHRVSWEIANAKEIPPGLFVLHGCDRPDCVNAAHLRIGTAQDNSWDAVHRNRTTFGKKLKRWTRPRKFLISVVLESPWRGDTDRHRRYLRDCLADCVRRGESPYASHGLLGDVLDDNDPEQRALALRACAAWRRKAERVVVYDDLGISPGMQAGIDDAKERGKPIEFRSLPAWKQVAACPPASGASSAGCASGNGNSSAPRRTAPSTSTAGCSRPASFRASPA